VKKLGTAWILSYHSILFGGFVHDPEKLVTGTAAVVDSWAKPNTTGRRLDKCMFSGADNKAQLCDNWQVSWAKPIVTYTAQSDNSSSCGENPKFASACLYEH
jgi:hypothetical protein